MQPNPILITLFSFLPALIAAIRKTKNRKMIYVIDGIAGLINIYMGFNFVDSVYSLGMDGFWLVTILSFLAWFGCLIAAIAGAKETSGPKKQIKNQSAKIKSINIDKITKALSSNQNRPIVYGVIGALVLIGLLTAGKVLAFFGIVIGIIFLMNKYKISEFFAFGAMILALVAYMVLGSRMSGMALFASMIISGYFLLIKRRFKQYDVLKTVGIAVAALLVVIPLERVIPNIIYDPLVWASFSLSIIAIYKVLEFIVHWLKNGDSVARCVKAIQQSGNKGIFMIVAGVLLCVCIGVYIYVNQAAYDACRDDGYKTTVCECVKSEFSTLEKLSYINERPWNDLGDFLRKNHNAETKVTLCNMAHMAQRMQRW